MSDILPPNRPQMGAGDARTILKAKGVAAPVAFLGVRGYFLDTMGAPGKNDRGVYDDAIFIVAENWFGGFNANTDPSVYRPGIAVLKTGIWKYQRGKHHPDRPTGYMAFTQAAEVTVARDGQGDDTGYFGINIHHGGENTTSSLGCQTIYPDQWPEFKSAGYSLSQSAGEDVIPYVLIDEAERRKLVAR